MAHSNSGPLGTCAEPYENDESFCKLVEQITREFETSGRLDESLLLQAHPEYAKQLRSLLPILKEVRGWANAESNGDGAIPKDGSVATSHPADFGGFRILRELGRGGMGVVYLAEQTSLHRQVALKILPLAAVMDSRHLQRFKNEVQAAALLQHQHIVPVYSVGSERGIHYYAMQYVEGSTLAELIAQVRHARGLDTGRPPAGADDRLERISSALTRDFMPADENERHGTPAQIESGKLPGGPRDASVETARLAVLSTAVSSQKTPEYYRAVARLALQAAEALDHAHSRGILHRDVKPGNLLVDGASHLWITDFGLARLQSDAGMTATGDLVGTLRYMSPEQVLGKRVVVDHRTDIYSLGATLYELASLQPAHAGDDRQELLKNVAFEEPRPLRHVDSRIPVELETITRKAMEKNPADRYDTAQAMADDLRRFLDHRPILARPPSVNDRIRKWSRRHVGVVWTALAASVLIGVLLAGAAAVIAKSAREAYQQRQLAVDEKDKAVAQEQMAVRQRDLARRNLYQAEIVIGQTEARTGNHAALHRRLVHYLPLPSEDDLRRWEWYYLLSRCRPEVRTLVYLGGNSFTYWSPDGKYLGSAGAIWDAATGEQVRCFDTSHIARSRGAWSPDGRKFAWGMAADESAFYIWDRPTDSVRRFAGHESSVWSIAWSPDGTQIASGSIDRTIRIWDVARQKPLWTSPDIHANVNSLAWSPDGQLLAAGLHHMKGLQLWDVARRELVTDGLFRSEPQLQVAWHPDGKTLAVCGDTRWALLRRADWSEAHAAEIVRGNALAYAPDGAQIAVAHGESVSIWNAAGKTLTAELKGHRYSVKSISWHPGGRQLVTADERQEIMIWDLDVPDGVPPIRTGAPIESLAWEQGDRALVTVAQADGVQSWWNPRDGRPERQEKPALESPFQLSPDRQLAAVYREEEHAVQIVEPASGATRAMLRLDPQGKYDLSSLSTDGSRLAIQLVYESRIVLEFWDVDRERRVATWSPSSRLSQFLWDRDSAHVAAVGLGDDGENGSTYWKDHLHVIDALTGRRLLKLLTPAGEGIESLAWSADGTAIAIGSRDGRIQVADLDQHRERVKEKLSEHPLEALAWHPDGTRLACGSGDGQVYLVDSQSGYSLLTFEPLQEPVTLLSYSNDGQRLAGATGAGEVRVWDASRGYELAAPDGPRRGELAWLYVSRAEDSEEKTAALQAFLQHAPDTLAFWTSRGGALARLGRYREAYQEYAKGIEPDMKFSYGAALGRACALLAAGERERFGEACAQLVETFRESPIPSNRGHVAWLCTLAPSPLVDFQQVLEMARVAEHDPDNVGSDDSVLYLGASLYRAGELEAAVSTLTKLIAKLDRGGDDEDVFLTACAKYFLALARLEMGHAFQAERLLAEANQAADEYPPPTSLRWHLWSCPVVLDTLRQEVEGRLGAAGKTAR